MKTILFLCTGNYFRSRFCEEVFNWHAKKNGLSCRADSAALAFERSTENVGPISEHTLKALERRGIVPKGKERFPRMAEEKDFSGADCIIALKGSEHRPDMELKYPAWASKVHYWDVSDAVGAPDEQLFSAMEDKVLELLASECRKKE